MVYNSTVGGQFQQKSFGVFVVKCRVKRKWSKSFLSHFGRGRGTTCKDGAVKTLLGKPAVAPARVASQISATLGMRSSGGLNSCESSYGLFDRDFRYVDLRFAFVA